MMHAEEIGQPVASSPTPLLEGKVAIITGASRGIGAVAARAFATAGAGVVLAARDADALSAVAEQITARGGRALAVPTDVGDPGAVARLVRKTIDVFGRLDAAFNNAGGGGHPPTPLADVAVADFDTVVRINLRGIFLCMKYEIPAMRASGGGAIVNMSSTAGLRGVGGIGAYVASKHGVIGLMRTLALEVATDNITVNCVCPGPVRTRVNDARIAYDAQRLGRGIDEYERGLTPIGGRLEPEDIAAMIVYLAGDAARMITGQAYNVDGGVNMA
jgi:NAD(P)-dependent dehydrogenase (short-subunit alcohol dehydrogenase family)